MDTHIVPDCQLLETTWRQHKYQKNEVLFSQIAKQQAHYFSSAET
jgi:hypothetical protein